MRICHIWQNFIPLEFGGVERYILSLSDFLSKQDQSLDFLMITDKAAYVPFSLAIRTSGCQRINSLEVHRLGPNLSSFLRSSSFKLLYRQSNLLDKMLIMSLFREASNIKGMDKVDVFHVHGFWQSLYPKIAASFKSTFPSSVHSYSSWRFSEPKRSFRNAPTVFGNT